MKISMLRMTVFGFSLLLCSADVKAMSLDPKRVQEAAAGLRAIEADQIKLVFLYKLASNPGGLFHLDEINQTEKQLATSTEKFCENFTAEERKAADRLHLFRELHR